MNSDYQIVGGPLPEFPRIQIGKWSIHYMTDIDKDNPYAEADFHIINDFGKVGGNRGLVAFTRQDIERKDLLDLIRSGKIYGYLNCTDLASRIKQDLGIILHFIENHEEYLDGPPFPEYIKD
jgi:hypothetical protein